jgi:hypothetical protein
MLMSQNSKRADVDPIHNSQTSLSPYGNAVGIATIVFPQPPNTSSKTFIPCILQSNTVVLALPLHSKTHCYPYSKDIPDTQATAIPKQDLSGFV